MHRIPARDDSLSVDFVPEQSLDTSEVPSPCLHWLFSKDGGYITRLKEAEDDAFTVQGDNMPSAKVEAIVMREVADYLQSQGCDEFWTPRTRIPGRVSCTYQRYALGF
jgi:hypothetical protein